MPGADWKSKKAYPDAKKTEAEDIAWEWLRRNCEYQRDYMALAASKRSSAMAHQFRRQWGLSFRS
ncbi:transcriptional regulator domain-containing protein [Bradyrhizobium sp. CCBAU 11361]|uniref:transcriptional regulator domain-containing protein n=1 Tax=Bradyrhizobium sp. CCBAU 11361 TaxID=1630812 RepID=UPI003FA4CFA9